MKKSIPQVCLCLGMTTMLLLGCAKNDPAAPGNGTLAPSTDVAAEAVEEVVSGNDTTDLPPSLTETPEPSEPPVLPVQPEPQRQQAEASQPIVQRPLPINTADLEEPQVVLSEGHKRTCRLFVGDRVADATVTDIQGTNRQLSRILGDHLTVIIFWTEDSAMAMEQFRRIPIDILADFGPRGVAVVAVHVGGDRAQVRNLTGDAADKITSLVDEEGKLFSQFGTAHIPRTYIIDGQGKILWFDIEYSQSTQRSIRNTLAYFLSHS